jgi:hypothetical protein
MEYSVHLQILKIRKIENEKKKKRLHVMLWSPEAGTVKPRGGQL